MKSLQYLTVQDILWINLQVTKKVQRYNYAKLEEAAFYQYAYGDSKDVISQTARFIPGFLKMNPFDVANRPTAFVAGMAFLLLNGYNVKAKDGQDILSWFEKVSDRKQAQNSVCDGVEKDHHEHHLDVRGAIDKVITGYPKAIQSLVAPVASHS
jgi:prophage maintenance system killer protein